VPLSNKIFDLLKLLSSKAKRGSSPFVPGKWIHDPYVQAGKAELVPIEWLRQFREYNREIQPKYKGQFEEVMNLVKQHGIDEPLMLQIGQKDRKALLGEGNTRLAALRKLGYEVAPVRVLRQQEVGSRGKAASMSKVPSDAYFPADTRPSQVFDDLEGEMKALLELYKWRAK
jgi:hypothetical protein